MAVIGLTVNDFLNRKHYLKQTYLTKNLVKISKNPPDIVNTIPDMCPNLVTFKQKLWDVACLTQAKKKKIRLFMNPVDHKLDY